MMICRQQASYFTGSESGCSCAWQPREALSRLGSRSPNHQPGSSQFRDPSHFPARSAKTKPNKTGAVVIPNARLSQRGGKVGEAAEAAFWPGEDAGLGSVMPLVKLLLIELYPSSKLTDPENVPELRAGVFNR
jgi:fatty acid desaturase